jgi:hypothetical protein
MPEVTILTDRSNFAICLIRGEALPCGIRLHDELVDFGGGGGNLILKVNLRLISGTAFAMWILRKVRSIPGNHRIRIDGQMMPIQMPRAIDVIAEELVNARNSLGEAA